MFPVSASMLKNPADYDASLEAFSRPLMTLVEYSLDEEGRMTVHNDTARWYRYIDMTPQAEALFRFIEQTIDTELVEELDVPGKLRPDQEGHPGDRGHAGPADRSLHPVLPAKQRQTLSAETCKPL